MSVGDLISKLESMLEEDGHLSIDSEVLFEGEEQVERVYSEWDGCSYVVSLSGAGAHTVNLSRQSSGLVGDPQ